MRRRPRLSRFRFAIALGVALAAFALMLVTNPFPTSVLGDSYPCGGVGQRQCPPDMPPADTLPPSDYACDPGARRCPGQGFGFSGATSGQGAATAPSATDESLMKAGASALFGNVTVSNTTAFDVAAAWTESRLLITVPEGATVAVQGAFCFPTETPNVLSCPMRRWQTLNVAIVSADTNPE